MKFISVKTVVTVLKEEFGVVQSLIGDNLRELIIIGSAVLFLTLSRYHSLGEEWSDALVFYAALPLLTILLLLRKNPLNFGLRPGNWRLWSLYVIVTCLIALPILYGTSRIGSLHTHYSVAEFDLCAYCWQIVVYLAAWEFLFRGYLLLGLKDKFKEASILIQMVPFVLLHLGKPEIETLSTIPMGIYLGYIAYRGNSCWPAVIIHIFINISFRIFANWF